MLLLALFIDIQSSAKIYLHWLAHFKYFVANLECDLFALVFIDWFNLPDQINQFCFSVYFNYIIANSVGDFDSVVKHFFFFL